MAKLLIELAGTPVDAFPEILTETTVIEFLTAVAKDDIDCDGYSATVTDDQGQIIMESE